MSGEKVTSPYAARLRSGRTTIRTAATTPSVMPATSAAALTGLSIAHVYRLLSRV